MFSGTRRTFPIEPRQVSPRGRLDAGGLRQRRQELLVALAGIATDDVPQRRVGFERRRVDGDRLAFDQAGLAESLQHPRENGAMCFEINQPTRAGDRRMVWWRVFEPHAQKVAQREGIPGTPRDAALRVNALEIAN